MFTSQRRQAVRIYITNHTSTLKTVKDTACRILAAALDNCHICVPINTNYCNMHIVYHLRHQKILLEVLGTYKTSERISTMPGDYSRELISSLQ